MNRATRKVAFEIIIGKQRAAPTGTVRCAFKREYTRFDNLEEHRNDSF